MRIVAVQLTQAEAADAAVMRNILTLLAETDGEVSIATGNGSGVALPPATSFLPPAPPAADVAPLPTAPVDDSAARAAKAAAAFGGAPVAMTPPAIGAVPGMTPPAPPTGPGAGAKRDVDAAGWPWDERIHSEPPSKTEKGLWRASRKAGASASKPTVEAELRALGFGVIAPPPPPAPVAQPGLTPEQQAQLLREQVELQARQPAPPAPAPAPVAPTPMAPPAAPTGGPARTFEALMMRVQHAITGMKVISHDWLKTNYLPLGIPNIMTLMQANEAIAKLHEMLDQYEVPDHVKA